MEHLRRSDPVDDLEPEALLPAVEGRRRQGLGGRHAQPHGVERAVRLRVAHDRAVERGDGAEHGRPVGAQRLEDPLGAGRAAHQDGRGAEPERERQAVAEPVGVEELRGREDDVVLPEAQHLAGEVLAGDLDVVLEVHDALGLPGGAGGVEPEGHVVAVGEHGIELLALRGEPGVQVDHVGIRRVAGDEPDLQPRHRLAQARHEVRVRDREARVRVLGVVGVVLRLVQRAHGHGDGADPHRAEEEQREDRRVVEDEQDAVLAPDAELAQEARPRG